MPRRIKLSVNELLGREPKTKPKHRAPKRPSWLARQWRRVLSHLRVRRP